jgi:hypothetical protein
MQNNFDLKQYLIENKLTRLSENSDEDFNITVGNNWDMNQEEEAVLGMFGQYGKPAMGSEDWFDFVYEWLGMAGLDMNTSSNDAINKRMDIVYNTLKKFGIELEHEDDY